MKRLNGFDAIIPKNPKVLILGSMPSAVSLERSEYYGHPLNRFWKIMSKYSNREFNTYEDKMLMLSDYGIVLWDVIQSCEREGSLDSKIKKVECNPLDELLEEYETISYVICNGKKAYSLFIQHFPKYEKRCVSLGSTSNANRSISEEELICEWVTTLKRVLED